MSSNLLQTTDFAGGLIPWLAQKAQAGSYTCLLAHADDGVIWGRFDGGHFTLSGDAFSELKVELRPETLQQARLFSDAGELFIWRVEDGFAYREIKAADEPEGDCFEETYRLWGEVDHSNKGFSLMVEGREGLRHAMPLSLSPGARAGLVVRHIIGKVDGQAAVVNSRLVRVKSV